MSYDPSSLPGWDIEAGGTVAQPTGYSEATQAAVAVSPPPAEPATRGSIVDRRGRAQVLNPDWQFFDAVAGDQNSDGTAAGYYRAYDPFAAGVDAGPASTDRFANGQWWMRGDDDAAFRDPTFEEYEAAGLWDFSNPDALGQIVGLDPGVTGAQRQGALDYYGAAATDPNRAAKFILDYGKVDAYGNNFDDVPGMLSQFDPEMQRAIAENMMGMLTAQQQDIQDQDWTDYADAGITMALNAAVMGGLGAGFGGLGASLAGGSATGAGASTTGAKTGATGAKLGGMLGKAGVGLLTGGSIDDFLRSLALSGGGEFFNGAEQAAEATTMEELDALDMQDADATSAAFQAQGGGAEMMDLFSPNSYMNQPGFVGANSLDEALENSVSPVYNDLLEGATYSPGMFSGYDAITGEAQFEGTPPGSLAAEPAPESNTVETVQKYAKVANTLNELLGGEAQGPQAPGPDASPEEQSAYAQQLVDYLSLDVNAMAEAGLEVGTPEYMDYILQQADSIIAQILSDMDVDSEDLASQLRTKTAEEMQQLQRALYVRGALGATRGSGEYTDPFSGLTEEVLGEDVNPDVAAYQRGVARNVTDLAGRSGGDALSFLNSMLSRDTDLYGMQQSADQRYEQALRQQAEEEDRKRRRGMFGAEFSL